jgi:hypothetical protein
VAKADNTDCGSFHPISLISFCFKTLERLVHWEIENTALKSHPFHPHQHSYYRCFGTDTAHPEVVNFVEQGKINVFWLSFWTLLLQLNLKLPDNFP